MNDFETETPSYRREGIESGPMYELHLDPQHVIVPNGRVIEVLRCDMPSSDQDTRFHIRHIAVELKPKRNGNHALKMGLRRDGGVWNLNEVEVTPEKLDDVMAFFEVVKREAAR